MRTKHRRVYTFLPWPSFIIFSSRLSLSLFLSLDLWPSSKIQAAPSRSIEPATWELEGIFLRFAIHVVHYNRLFLRKGDSRRRRGLPFRNTALYLSKQAANDAVRAWRMIVKDRELVRFVSTLSQFLLSFLFRLSFRLFSPFFSFLFLHFISLPPPIPFFFFLFYTLCSLSHRNWRAYVICTDDDWRRARARRFRSLLSLNSNSL